MAVYDDQKTSDEELRKITGVGTGEEDQMEAAAREGAKKDLKAAEENPTLSPGAGERAKSVTPEHLKKFEEGVGMGTGPGRAKLRALTFFQKHKKGIIFSGAGGGTVLAVVSAVFLLLPNYRIPSDMGLISKVTGEAVEEIVENRAERLIISYLIQKAGGTPDDYVITDSLLGTLWATFRTNRLEDKIERQTGIRLERGDNGNIRVRHDGRDMGSIDCSGALRQKTCVDRVKAILDTTPKSKRDFRKIVRLSVPAWRFHKASKMARYLSIKYNFRYGAPERDKAKTKNEALKDLRAQQVDIVYNNTIPAMADGFSCILDDNKDSCARFDDKDRPTEIREGRPPDLGDNTDKSSKQVVDTVNDAAKEARDEVVNTGGSFVEKLTQKILTKLIGTTATQTAMKAIPIVGWIDAASVINHMAYTSVGNQIGNRIPAILTSTATGAMYSQWMGYSDQIKAGKMDILYVGALTTQLAGERGSPASESAAYKFAAGKDPSTGTKVESRVNNNLENPMWDLAAKFMGVRKYLDPLEWWYDTVGRVFRAAEGFVGWVIGPVVNQAIEAFDFLMKKAFGDDWLYQLTSTVMDFMLELFAISVDPMAKGAKLVNQLYTGADVAHNDYCRTNLGCRATSPMIDKGYTYVPVEFGYNSPSQANKEDMAALPLSDRLFSLDEPYSLVNQTIRAMPQNNSPVTWLSTTFKEAAALPAKLFAAISGKAHAYHGSPDEKADIAGVRQYGATAQDLDQDIAEQVRTQASPECPDNDPDNMFNLCQADKEITQSLMCVYTDCPEFQVGGIERPGDNTTGLVANLKRLWSDRSTTSTLGAW